MEIIITRTIETLILPPGGPVLLTILGIILVNLNLRFGKLLVTLGLGTLLLVSLPIFSRTLLATLENSLPLTVSTHKGAPRSAIIILGGGRRTNAPEYSGDTLSNLSLERLRYGAFLYRKTGYPIIVTGGTPYGSPLSEAQIMREVLRKEFYIQDVQAEEQSRNTAKNAEFSLKLLRERGIHTIYLVSHAWHLRRTLPLFQAHDMMVIPAPTGFSTKDSNRPLILDWMPQAQALNDSRIALHEWLGILWYKIRYQIATNPSS
jgi:uncharacterized SAM-binding protein YcdF (DUF218 family)